MKKLITKNHTVNISAGLSSRCECFKKSIGMNNHGYYLINPGRDISLNECIKLCCNSKPSTVNDPTVWQWYDLYRYGAQPTNSGICHINTAIDVRQ